MAQYAITLTAEQLDELELMAADKTVTLTKAANYFGVSPSKLKYEMRSNGIQWQQAVNTYGDRPTNPRKARPKDAPHFRLYNSGDGFKWECPPLGLSGWRKAKDAFEARQAIALQLAKAKLRTEVW